jgi:hypothetical protein
MADPRRSGIGTTGGTLSFNIAFTKTTKPEAVQEWQKNVFRHREEARVGSNEPGITEELEEDVTKLIEEFDQQGHTINVEVSGPEPLRILIEKGPR